MVMERFIVPLDPSVRHTWKVGDRFQVMKTIDSGTDYEVVEVRDTEMVVAQVAAKPKKPPAPSFLSRLRPASHRRRRSSLAEP